ncbi:hypothetical protein PsorP6_007692 [Peronosclerospora sorghi]|uniref:Uncharacterized protein n=1 Tax=Peronosclerospora sorghi TaxID=230839 RepID=A0ACC0WAY6_9STRA|nr:hypothetical protein PsorP6_007692 [Peronosclerospora sorghi]
METCITVKLSMGPKRERPNKQLPEASPVRVSSRKVVITGHHSVQAIFSQQPNVGSGRVDVKDEALCGHITTLC